MPRRRLIRTVVLATSASLSCALVVEAQTLGRLVGTVRDPQGAVVGSLAAGPAGTADKGSAAPGRRLADLQPCPFELHFLSASVAPPQPPRWRYRGIPWLPTPEVAAAVLD